jgi:dihydrofolate synthase/folylpolyglutamate synthase
MSNHHNYFTAVARLQSVIHVPDANYMQPQEDRTVFLERMRRLCERVGVLDTPFQIVHVAGTSGKGSTSTMIYEMLRASGAHVGIFRSPFVTTSIENIEVDGQLIAPDNFARLVDYVMLLASDASYSELFFAIAMRYFVDSGCAWVVLETGCGGRFDYTNVVASSQVRASVLTPINLDHTDILGKTLEEIAWHKAGIIKEGVPVLSTETKPAVRAVFDREAAEKQTHVQYVQPTRHVETAMFGEHQQWNAAAAEAVGRLLELPDEAIARGIATARLPARVEVMQHDPLVILDGAHSVAKMQALVASLDAFRPWKKLHLVFAAKETKDVADVLRPIASLADEIWITTFQLPGFGSHRMEETADSCARLAPHATIYREADPRIAVERCLATAAPDDCVVITGSLYLAGFVRKRWISEEEILDRRAAYHL